MSDPLKGIIEEIRADLGYKESEDSLAASFLCELLRDHPRVLRPEDLPVEEEVVVVGAGPSIAELPKIVGELEDSVVYAADGACRALLELGIVPDVIVTDLDGPKEYLLMSSECGSITVVHAHGDNMTELAELVPTLGRILGTCQVEPPCDLLHNFGGFTDGDRAVVMAARLGAERVLTVGMDFGNLTTEYSRPDEGKGVFRADPVKRRKLAWGERVLRLVERELGVEVESLTARR
ncbi:6-hydroxymethylpterin diphosphokinase MptE-like protein [Methanopyrus kandleri]